MSYSSSLAATPVHAVAAPVLSVVDGVVTTTSLAVAEYFVKSHDDVLRKIRTVFADCPSDFSARNFAVSTYSGKDNISQPSYRITRKGFTFLAMGFTGKRANVFKIAYIDEFDRMEAALLAPATPTTKSHAVASALQQLRSTRFELRFDRLQSTLHEIPDDACIANPDEFAAIIKGGWVRDDLLPEIIEACVGRLAPWSKALQRRDGVAYGDLGDLR